MIVLVSDTSVLIDLERATLVEAALSLPYKFAVPDLLYENELREFGGPALLELGLRVESLVEAEVVSAAAARRRCNKLSVVDTFALALAQGRGWMLLAGDALLRAEAIVQKVECHGCLWVIDEIERAANVDPLHLAHCLTRLVEHPRCRLPRKEVDRRVNRLRA